MSRPSPSHDAVWVRQLAAELSSRGFSAKQLLAQVGLDERHISAEDARIPFAKHAAFFELAAETAGDSRLGLHFGMTRETRDAGLLGYVGVSSATLLDGIRSLSRYRRVFSDASEFDIAGLAITGRVRWWFYGLGHALPRKCLEFTAVNLVRAFREVCGRHLIPEAVTFVHTRIDDVEEFERYFGCPVSFGCEENVIALTLSDLRLRLVEADDRLLALLRRYCQDVLARHPPDVPNLEERIERLVMDRLTNSNARFGEIAIQLGMSPRTLSRKLAERGTSYREIVDNLRKELALRYLQDDRLSSTEIAFLLGYNELSTFNHALKRWTGMTPTQHRRKKAS
jgi:AraC-like DNA-binding protein